MPSPGFALGRGDSSAILPLEHSFQEPGPAPLLRGGQDALSKQVGL